MDPRLRVSDADRERVVATLRRHVGEGRLSLDEFSERCDQAYAARTAGDLDALVIDLPAEERAPRPSPTRATSLVAQRWWLIAALAVFLVGVLVLGGWGAIAAMGGPMMNGMCP